MNSTVAAWYDKTEHIEEMKGWDKGKLKIWEQQIADMFPSGAKILDIGSGMGREAFSLYRQGFEVHGLDISKYAVEKAKEEAGKNKQYIKEHYSYCLEEDKFYPYIERDIYWETFSLEKLVSYAEAAGFDVIMSGEGEIYVPEDGIILYCLGKVKIGV